MPRAVLELRRLEPVTPYRADEWERALRDAGLEREYRHVVHGLRHGFQVGFPDIAYTQCPPNRASVDEYRPHFDSIIASELAAGRYVGPFTRAEMEEALGHYQSSPMSIIQKATAGKYRVLQNFSFPRAPSKLYPQPSINSAISSSDWPCTYGTFRSFCILISALPPGSQMAVLDVREAFRGCPVHPSQWPAGVVRTDDDTFYADTCAAFGSSSSPGVHGSVADAGCEIIRSRGMGPITKWVDDHPIIRVLRAHLSAFNEVRASWRKLIGERGRQQTNSRTWYGGQVMADGGVFEMFEDCSFPLLDLSASSPRTPEEAEYAFGLPDLFATTNPLGIDWEHSKTHQFASTAPYFGFSWDVEEKTVSLPREKAAKYLGAIREWERRDRHTLEDIQQLYGKLLHASLVVPAGRARLLGLERALGLAYRRPFASLFPPRLVRPDLEWWAGRLSGPTLSRSIVIPQSLVDVNAYSDASTGTGIGVIIGEQWRAWRLLPGWRERDGEKDIGWAEAVGFYLLVAAVVERVPGGSHLRVYGDNEGVVKGWRNHRSRNTATNAVFKLLHDLLEERGFVGCIFAEYVPTDLNPADGPSRGIFPGDHLLLPPVVIPPSLVPFIVDARAPDTAPIVSLHHGAPGAAVDTFREDWEYWPTVEDEQHALASALE